MGIAYKDLKAGTYYKGDDPTGAKLFMYVEQTAPHHAPNVQVTTWVVQRTKKAPLGSTTAGQWTYQPNQILPGTQDSYMRRAVTPAEVQAEQIALVKPGTGTSASQVAPPKAVPSSTAAPGSRPFESVASTPMRSAPPSKPPALRKNGTPKALVEGNSTSKACLCCAKPNKILVLFRGSTFFCPDCEP